MFKNLNKELSKKDKAKMLNDIVSGKESEAYKALLKEVEDAKDSMKIEAYTPNLLTFMIFYWSDEREQIPIRKEVQEIYDYLKQVEKPCQDIEEYRKVYKEVEEKYKDYFNRTYYG